ncbi:MAG: hypothetical protein A3J93_02225 [Candidatus Magasanikbacteria bacterium RIFOXYC2_FULL_42_28]|uniref:Nudix hydrolase domain-containing protein n=1 Tax=Candidatus Magasanikbacteria bacterium RIFOXYC2_FULL_42_28 TaxID=1798704 RepID=A0A1F6NVJ5_9BACT|nr:MAG: hypothetical protein A3J93_02225 [Candidatus Magasanikbacteria bacterium RIFOXYC2_FULL_42_28]
MATKIGKTANGDALHYSVGVIIKQYGKFLLIDRTTEPFGFAVLAGHVNENETPEVALVRIVDEESGLKIVSHHQEYEGEVQGNWCNRGIGVHYWYVYECEVSGDPILVVTKAKSIGWYTPEEVRKLKLDPAVHYWFKKIKLI